MTESAELLRRYAEEGSEPAFGELVARHINLVYSAALRLVGGDAHLAQDVVQTVFVALAHKAATLPRSVVLSGWLYRHTSFVAATAVRTERRRQARERQAAEMNALNDTPEPRWETIAPFLDEAMQHLGAGDRDALLLRYFEHRDLRTVGTALGISEDAAQKRVTRALEKLRILLIRRGVTLSATTLAAFLASQAVVTAPAGLAAAVTSVSLAGAAAGAGISITLLKFMGLTKLKIGVVSVAVVAGFVAPLVLQQQSLNKLRVENERQRAQLEELAALRFENARLARLKVDADELERLRKEHLELLRLRGLFAVQQRKGEEPIQPPAPNRALQSPNTIPGGQALNLIRYLATPPGASKVTLAGTSTLHDWTMEGRIISGFFETGPAFPANLSLPSDPSSARTGSIARAEVSIPVRSLKSQYTKMDEIMQEAMRAKAYPQIRFKLREMVLQGVPPDPGSPIPFATKGELAISGVTNSVDMDIFMERIESGQLKFSGSKRLRMTDFMIQPPAPTLGVGLIKTGDEVTIQFEWIVTPAR